MKPVQFYLVEVSIFGKDNYSNFIFNSALLLNSIRQFRNAFRKYISEEPERFLSKKCSFFRI
jgi:hypothetical protein